MAFSVVVLPAPFGPRRATTSPAADVQRDVADDRRAVVAGGQALDGQDRVAHHPASRVQRVGGAARARAAQVGLDHARIAADLVGRPRRDHLAELEHDDVVADAEHEAHVVVDEQDRRALVDDPAQLAPELLALGRVEAGAGLVEADDARRARERPRHADELALALGELVGQPVGHALEAHEVQRIVGRGLARRRPPEDLAQRAPHRRRLRGDREVLGHGQVVEELGRLPRARQAAARALVRRQPRQLAAVQLDAPAGAHEAGDRVDEGRLARAVGADQPDHGALGHLEPDVDERLHAAEAHRHALGLQRRRHDSLAVPAIAER